MFEFSRMNPVFEKTAFEIRFGAGRPGRGTSGTAFEDARKNQSHVEKGCREKTAYLGCASTSCNAQGVAPELERPVVKLFD